MGLLITGNLSQCGLVSGQLKRLFVSNWTDLKGSLIISDGIVTDITAPLDWFEFDLIKDKAVFIENGEYTENGIRYISQIDYQIAEVKSDTQKRINELVRGKFILLCQDSSSKWFLFGRLGAEVNQQSNKIGANDNSYNFPFLANDLIPSYQVSNDYYLNNIKGDECGETGIYTDDITTLSVPLFQILSCPVSPV